MDEQADTLDRATAEIRRRVEAGRADGTYPAELDERLLAEFAHLGKDPLWFGSFERLRPVVARLRQSTSTGLAKDNRSAVPGGAVAHRVVAKLVSRQVAALVVRVTEALDVVVEALDETRSVIQGDVLADLDSVHHRLVDLEHRVARAELRANGTDLPDGDVPETDPSDQLADGLAERPVQLHQVLVGAREGDAITQIAINLRTILGRFGRSQIFAHHVDPSVASSVGSIDDLAAQCGPGDVVVLHVSIGDAEVWDAVYDTGARLWVWYHNITPAELFGGDLYFAGLLRAGRQQLVDAKERIERLVAVSEYNRRDLIGMGFDEIDVVPGLLDPFRLAAQPSDPGFAREISRRVPGAMILFVGQLMPHKRPEILIAALHEFLLHTAPDATLVLAGHHPSQNYLDRITVFTASMGLDERVWITGGLSDPCLAELYRRADLLTTASAHEGLCLPVVEAMAMSVPVVASGCGALPETMDGSGVVVESDSPSSYTDAWRSVMGGANRPTLMSSGRRRARELSLPVSTARAHAAVEEWLTPPG